MSKPDLMALAEEERTELLGLLQSLTDDQWNAQSLCAQWRVRDVAAHVVSYDELSALTTVGTFIRGGLRVNSVNAVALERYDDVKPPETSSNSRATCDPAGSPKDSAGASH